MWTHVPVVFFQHRHGEGIQSSGRFLVQHTFLVSEDMNKISLSDADKTNYKVLVGTCSVRTVCWEFTCAMQARRERLEGEVTKALGVT